MFTKLRGKNIVRYIVDLSLSPVNSNDFGWSRVISRARYNISFLVFSAVQQHQAIYPITETFFDNREISFAFRTLG